jgi:hypothetical protein
MVALLQGDPCVLVELHFLVLILSEPLVTLVRGDPVKPGFNSTPLIKVRPGQFCKCLHEHILGAMPVADEPYQVIEKPGAVKLV